MRRTFGSTREIRWSLFSSSIDRIDFDLSNLDTHCRSSFHTRMPSQWYSRTYRHLAFQRVSGSSELYERIESISRAFQDIHYRVDPIGTIRSFVLPWMIRVSTRVPSRINLAVREKRSRSTWCVSTKNRFWSRWPSFSVSTALDPKQWSTDQWNDCHERWGDAVHLPPARRPCSNDHLDEERSGARSIRQVWEQSVALRRRRRICSSGSWWMRIIYDYALAMRRWAIVVDTNAKRKMLQADPNKSSTFKFTVRACVHRIDWMLDHHLSRKIHRRFAREISIGIRTSFWERASFSLATDSAYRKSIING